MTDTVTMVMIVRPMIVDGSMLATVLYRTDEYIYLPIVMEEVVVDIIVGRGM